MDIFRDADLQTLYDKIDRIEEKIDTLIEQKAPKDRSDKAKAIQVDGFANGVERPSEKVKKDE